MALRRSCHPTQLAPPPAARAAAQLSALPVSQQCTQMAQNSSERPFSAICVHYCVPLCVTRGRPRDPPAPQQCTQMPRNGSVRPFSAICVHYCVPLRHHGTPAQPPCRNSVHKWPRTAPRGRFRRSVYTIASPPAARATPVSQQCTQMPRNGSEEPFRRSVYTIVSPRAVRATPVSQQCTQMAQNGSERTFSAICVHYCVPLRHQGAPAQPPRLNSVHICPETVPRGRFRRSVYTIVSPPAARESPALQQCTQSRSP